MTSKTTNGLYKAEVIHRRGPWRSFETVEFAALTSVDWSNRRRLLEPIDNIPPAEAADFGVFSDETDDFQISTRSTSSRPAANHGAARIPLRCPSTQPAQNRDTRNLLS